MSAFDNDWDVENIHSVLADDAIERIRKGQRVGTRVSRDAATFRARLEVQAPELLEYEVVFTHATGEWYIWRILSVKTTRQLILESGEPDAGQDLAARRRALRMTQAQLAAHLGVAANTVARWERNEMTIQHPRMVEAALSALERNVGEKRG